MTNTIKLKENDKWQKVFVNILKGQTSCLTHTHNPHHKILKMKANTHTHTESMGQFFTGDDSQ